VELVRRIRRDEELHLESLRVALGEARAVHWKSLDGGHLPGHTLIDPFWARLVHWATVEQPKLVAERSRTLLSARILAHPEGANVLKRFDALTTA
jgi:hypothetical protein